MSEESVKMCDVVMKWVERVSHPEALRVADVYSECSRHLRGITLKGGE